VVENDGVTQMQGVRKKIRDRENFLDLSFGVTINIFTKDDRGFVCYLLGKMALKSPERERNGCM
jgi:hypothetical protein